MTCQQKREPSELRSQVQVIAADDLATVRGGAPPKPGPGPEASAPPPETPPFAANLDDLQAAPRITVLGFTFQVVTYAADPTKPGVMSQRLELVPTGN
jgi:hypothetical protein